MIKKYTLHLDALVALFLLFLVSVIANIYLVKTIDDTGKQLLDTQGELLVMKLNLLSRNDELAACQDKLVSDIQ